MRVRLICPTCGGFDHLNDMWGPHVIDSVDLMATPPTPPLSARGDVVRLSITSVNLQGPLPANL